MRSVKEIVTGSIISPYRGGVKSREMVREQIRQRWGDECAEEFDPTCDAAPYSFWLSAGFQVRKCQKALKSITFVDGKDEKGEIKKIMRTVNLFHRRQVEKIA